MVHRVHGSPIKTCVAGDFCWGQLQEPSQEWAEKTKDCILPGECTQGTKNKLLEEHSSYLFPSMFLGTLLFPAGENEANRLINVWLILQYTRDRSMSKTTSV